MEARFIWIGGGLVDGLENYEPVPDTIADVLIVVIAPLFVVRRHRVHCCEQWICGIDGVVWGSHSDRPGLCFGLLAPFHRFDRLPYHPDFYGGRFNRWNTWQQRRSGN